MKSAVDMVTAFHVAMQQAIGGTASLEVDRELRIRLIDEEFQELRDALAANEVIGVADALADLCYVVVGSAVTWGIPLAEVFAEVHRSNMTKVGGGRREDGKILKPAGYTPPDIAGVLAKHAKALELLSDEKGADDLWYEPGSPRLRRVFAELPGTVHIRVGHALANRGVHTLAQLTATSLRELRKTKHLGKTSVAGIELALAKFGLRLVE